MSQLTMQIPGRTRRHSDGAVVCSKCNNIIPPGAAYVQETGFDLSEDDICLHCMEREDRRDAALDAASWLLVVAVAVGMVALFCYMVKG